MELVENRSAKKEQPRDGGEEDIRAQKAVLIIKDFLSHLPHN